MASEKQRKLVSAEEEQDIARKMMIWANAFSDDDMPAATINYEFLAADSASMALSTIQGAYITKKYITGGHEAEYQFKLIARIIPGNSNDKRLRADAMLNRFGDWAAKNYPSLGDGVRVRRMESASRAAMFARYEDGSEDHQILMKMTYEVI
uniref:Minor capsid protein from bacteriophage n=1 Tax=Siphoviridae sp. ctfHp48 TaxID=2827583 RepID=A0A8S5RT15_9CAUD|nr:MAG TPA: Minor capsid protein from bacteriophage [Siphoviridae sp. ctfHp48]